MPGLLESRHYAFYVKDEEFDGIFGRVKAKGPGLRQRAHNCYGGPGRGPPQGQGRIFQGAQRPSVGRDDRIIGAWTWGWPALGRLFFPLVVSFEPQAILVILKHERLPGTGIDCRCVEIVGIVGLADGNLLIFGDVSALPGRASEPTPSVKGQGGGLRVLRLSCPGGQWRTL